MLALSFKGVSQRKCKPPLIFETVYTNSTTLQGFFEKALLVVFYVFLPFKSYEKPSPSKNI